jgi:uncharacterized delta-60 repeat protein
MKYIYLIQICLFFLCTGRVYSQAGVFDSQFGNNGIMFATDEQRDVREVAVAIQDGKILVAGTYNLEQNNSSAFLRRYKLNGDLDNTFGQYLNGQNNYSFSLYKTINYFLKLDSQNRIYIGGRNAFSGYKSTCYVARLNQNGVPDPTFNNVGLTGSQRGVGYDLAIQSDNKIVVVGSLDFSADTSITNTDCIVLRYKENGKIDTTFNHTGVKRIDFSELNELGRYVIVQPDGKILVFGEALSSLTFADRLFVLRLNPNGEFDNSFGDNGVFFLTSDVQWQHIYGAHLYSNGKILIGNTYNEAGFGLIKLNTDGTFDESFGLNGKVDNVFFPDARLNAFCMTVQPDDKILVGGFVGPLLNYESLIARFLPDGSLDNSFSDDGHLRVALKDSISVWTSIELLPDNRIVMAGSANSDQAPIYKLAIGMLSNQISIGVEEVSDIADEEVGVYPNPATDKITLFSEEPITGMIRIFDALGRIVWQGAADNVKMVDIPVSELDSGIYNLWVSGRRSVIKVFVTK